MSNIRSAEQHRWGCNDDLAENGAFVPMQGLLWQFLSSFLSSTKFRRSIQSWSAKSCRTDYEADGCCMEAVRIFHLLTAQSLKILSHSWVEQPNHVADEIFLLLFAWCLCRTIPNNWVKTFCHSWNLTWPYLPNCWAISESAIHRNRHRQSYLKLQQKSKRGRRCR